MTAESMLIFGGVAVLAIGLSRVMWYARFGNWGSIPPRPLGTIDQRPKPVKPPPKAKKVIYVEVSGMTGKSPPKADDYVINCEFSTNPPDNVYHYRKYAYSGSNCVWVRGSPKRWGNVNLNHC